MADSLSIPTPALVVEAPAIPARHSVLVRITHWLTTLSFFALLLSGIELIISHPRFYWGEVGNIWVKPLFQIHIPASRAMVVTGYNYTLPDQNGWSRYLHFQSAWILVLAGLLYVVSGLVTRHFRNDLLPEKNTFSWSNLSSAFRHHLSFKRPAETASYNLLQRLTYLAVVFGLVPLAIWTGLAMSPAFVSAFPLTVTILGGTQSARTIHFFVSIALTLFVLVHVIMVVRSGFRRNMKAMTIGTPQ